MEQILSVENLTIDYPVKEGMLSAVNNVSFTINKGEVFALVGESGCGKSTVASSIMRLLMEKNTSIKGKINFLDKDLLSISTREMEKIRGRDIGMIFQNPLDSLNPVYRSGSQVHEALILDKISHKEAWERVISLYKDVQISDPEKRIKSFPHEMSGGMRQRIMIAMMLSRRPQLLIADEPTTALDVTIESQILDIIKQLKEIYNTAIFVITHNFGIVAEIADKVGVMYAGELVELGDVFTLISSPKHPYTKALINALPRQSSTTGRIETIDGVVSRIIGPYKGCRFQDRCKHVYEKCRNEQCSLKEIHSGYFVSCHREA